MGLPPVATGSTPLVHDLSVDVRGCGLLEHLDFMGKVATNPITNLAYK